MSDDGSRGNPPAAEGSPKCKPAWGNTSGCSPTPALFGQWRDDKEGGDEDWAAVLDSGAALSGVQHVAVLASRRQLRGRLRAGGGEPPAPCVARSARLEGVRSAAARVVRGASGMTSSG